MIIKGRTMKLRITDTEIFADQLTKPEYNRLNRVASKLAHRLNAHRETRKEKIQGFMVYSSSYESANHCGYCYQVGHPQAGGRYIHAHDEFYEPILIELRKMNVIR